ncbi:MAG TPA: FAD-dependent monooxygenase [Porticoccaceae bacterium]|nr:FAD-dependent monooxygenase [Porticoccaceae bacterium]
MHDCDVLVVGAGPVGAAFALALAQAPAAAQLRILLVETQPAAALDETPLLEPRALALSPRSRKLLERLGAWTPELAARACSYQTMEVWDRSTSGRVGFDSAEIHQPELGHILGQPALVAALTTALRAQPNIVLRCPATVTGIERLVGGGCGIRLGAELVRTALLVAADGPDSPVREHFGIATQRWDPGQQALVAVLRTERAHGHCARQWFAPSGPLAFLPLAGDRHHVAIVWSQERVEAERLHALDAQALARALELASEGVLGSIALVGPPRLIPLHQHHADSYVLPGVALLGDAAHVVHPLAGQGVNLGLADAEVLAAELVAGLDGGGAIASCAAEALARYQRRRRPENLAMLAAMRGFKTLFGDTRLPVSLLRAAGMVAFERLAPLKHLVMAAAAGERWTP